MLFCIFALACIVYLPSLSVPFYLDDLSSIVNNPTFQSPTALNDMFSIYGMRVIGYYSLYFNYLLPYETTASYHIVNLIIHLINGCLVYKLYFAICAYLKIETHKKVALMMLVLWLLHPLNTQAVTYTVQRLASLVALFSFVALFSYLKWRVTSQFKWLFMAIVGFVCAIFTKQNAVFIPVFIYLVELFYASNVVKRKLKFSALLAMLAFAILYPFIPELLHKIDMATRENHLVTRFDYFNTQLYVHFIYLKKFLLLEPLALTIDVNIMNNSAVKALSYLIHMSILAFVVLCHKRYRLVSFSIILYYCAHIVESSIIPITDLAFEHRTYISNIALSMIAASFIVRLTHNKHKALLPCIAVIICIGLAKQAYDRNTLWQTPDKFFMNEFDMAPNNPRNLEAIGRYYAAKEKFELAEEYLSKSVDANFKLGRLTASSVTNLMKVYLALGDTQRAVMAGQKALSLVKKGTNRSEVLGTLSLVYAKMRHCDFATGLATTALKLNPYNDEAKRVLEYCG